MKFVGTALGDSVDGTTRETALSHVKRSHIDLNLVDGSHRYGLCAGLSTVASVRGKTKHVVVHGTINLESIVTVVGAGKRHGTRLLVSGNLRVEARNICYAVRDGRHVVNPVCTDTLGSARLGGIESGLSGYNHLLQHLGILFQRAGEILRLTQEQTYVVETLGLVSDVRYFHLVRTAWAHSLNGVTSIGIGHCAIHSTRWLMGSRDSSANHLIALRNHFSVDTGSRDLSHSRCCTEHHHHGQ